MCGSGRFRLCPVGLVPNVSVIMPVTVANVSPLILSAINEWPADVAPCWDAAFTDCPIMGSEETHVQLH